MTPLISVLESKHCFSLESKTASKAYLSDGPKWVCKKFQPREIQRFQKGMNNLTEPSKLVHRKPGFGLAVQTHNRGHENQLLGPVWNAWNAAAETFVKC